jgi:hypothetical protein
VGRWTAFWQSFSQLKVNYIDLKSVACLKISLLIDALKKVFYANYALMDDLSGWLAIGVRVQFLKDSSKTIFCGAAALPVPLYASRLFNRIHFSSPNVLIGKISSKWDIIDSSPYISQTFAKRNLQIGMLKF